MKQVVILFVFFTITFISNAQDSKYAIKKQFGFKGGLTFAGVSPDKITDGGFGFQAGILGRFELNRQHAILVEMNFVRENTSVARFSNLQIPLMLQSKLNHWLSIEMGPQLVLNLHNKPPATWYFYDIPNELFISLGSGLLGKVDDNNFFNFRYCRGITPMVRPKGFSSMAALTLVHLF